MPGFEVFGNDELEAVQELFRANGGILFAHGFDVQRKGIYRVREFEKAFSRMLGSGYAQAVSSASAALKVALKALDIKRGDEVITQAHTFVATVEAILEAGATPVIVNINETFNIDPQEVEEKITDKTRAVIPVHMMGAPAQMDEIMSVAQKNNLAVIEDVAQGGGGTYRGRPLGTIGTIGAFSFDFGKTITTGEGGMVVTSSEDLFVRARAAHDHGHSYREDIGRGVEPGILSGFNYRMTEIQGAIGLVQLGKLGMIIKEQRKNKRKLKDRISHLPVTFRQLVDEQGDLGDTIIFYLDHKEQAQKFAEKLAAAGIGTKNLPDAIVWHFAQHWTHIFEEHNLYMDSYLTEWKRSADLLERSIALPVAVKMSDDQITEISNTIIQIAGEVL